MAEQRIPRRLLHAVRTRVTPLLRAPTRSSPTAGRAREPDLVDPDLVPLLTELGVSLLDAGQATNEVEDALRRIAGERSQADVRAFVVPTGVMVQVDEPDGGARTHYASSTGRAVSLNQVGLLDKLSDDVAQGKVALDAARARLVEIAATPPRFGPAVRVVGHTLVAVGVGMCQHPSFAPVAGLAILGALVGLGRVAGARFGSLAVALPVLASFVVTVLVMEVISPWVHVDPVTLIAPPLVPFLPGAALTTATIELTHNQVVSGASRLVYGLAQLLLLAFGVVAGIAVVGEPFDAAGVAFTGGDIQPWIAYLGVALVACGDVLYSSAPRRSLLWIALALYAAFVAQKVGSLLISAQLSGFFGGLVLMVVARLIALTRSGPDRLVTALPGFWLLVPGSLGFLGMSELATSGAQAITDLVNMVLALFSITLGVLTGTGLTKEMGTIRRSLRRRGG